MMDLTAFATLGSDPIAGDAPAGASIRYDEGFIALEAEMSKLDNPAGGDVDWRHCLEQCQRLLAEHSKDLLLAAWLVRCLHEQAGLPGLAAGLSVVRDMLASHWEGLFPNLPRIKARRAALEWFSERAAALLSDDRISPVMGTDLETCRNLVGDIEGFAAEDNRFQGEDCGLGNLRRRLDECLIMAGGVVGEGSTDAEVQQGETEMSSTPSTVSAGGSGRPGGPPQSRAEAISRLRELHAFFQKTEPHSPISPLLARALSWTGKSFEEVFTEILGAQHDGRWRLYDQLGIPVPEN